MVLTWRPCLCCPVAVFVDDILSLLSLHTITSIFFLMIIIKVILFIFIINYNGHGWLGSPTLMPPLLHSIVAELLPPLVTIFCLSILCFNGEKTKRQKTKRQKDKKTKRQKEKKTKRQKDKKTKTKKQVNIGMSGQYCTLAMFLNIVQMTLDHHSLVAKFWVWKWHLPLKLFQKF